MQVSVAEQVGFESYSVRNHKDRLSIDEAHMAIFLNIVC